MTVFINTDNSESQQSNKTTGSVNECIPIPINSTSCACVGLVLGHQAVDRKLKLVLVLLYGFTSCLQISH